MALRRPSVTALLLLCSKSTQAYHHHTHFHPSAAASIAKPNIRRSSSPPHLLFNFSPPPPPPPATTPATQVVRRDLFGYVGLISLVAATPAIDWNGIGGNELSNIARLSYFTVVAIGSVYLGVRRQDIGETAPITGKSAALAPFIATATLGGLYLIIKYTALDPGTFYRGVACLFALLSTSELLQPLLGLAIAGELTRPADYAFDDEREKEIMDSGALPAFAIALSIIAAYLQGPVSTGGTLPLPIFASLSNSLGWGITMASLGVLALESFTAASALLIGLFFYDAFFVFKSDVMLTVATQIEAPAKFLFAAVREAGDERYPFSVLGLGDVVVPGAFVSLMREVDKDGLDEKPRRAKADEDAPLSYFNLSLGAYAIGLCTTFVANYVTRSGQPALVYIVPSLLLTAAGAALYTGQFSQLIEYKSSRAAAAAAAREEWKEERAREKARANK